MAADDPSNVKYDSWRPEDRPLQRIIRAITAPAVAGGIVFLVALATAILLVILRPTGEQHFDDAVIDSGSASDHIDSEQHQPLINAQSSSDLESEAPNEPVFVHVTGEVLLPGVVELISGSRVEAAINAAGGPTELAVLASVNLARLVVDGEQIVVPDAELAANTVISSESANDANGGTGASGIGVSGPELINLNTADAVSLETLPRIGPALAARIIAWRETNGNFSSIEDLVLVSGIGPKVFLQLQDLVTVQ